MSHTCRRVCGTLSWRIKMRSIVLGILLAVLLINVAYADPDFDSVVRLPELTGVTAARATIKIDALPSCPGAVCSEMSYVSLLGGIRFGRFGLCASSDYSYVRPCYRLTAQRVVLHLPYDLQIGQRVRVYVIKQGRDLIVKWVNVITQAFVQIRFTYDARWEDEDSRSYTGVSIYSSDSRVNPRVNTTFLNVVPAGGVLTSNSPDYHPIYLSETAWRLVR